MSGYTELKKNAMSEKGLNINLLINFKLRRHSQIVGLKNKIRESKTKTEQEVTRMLHTNK